MEKLANTVIRIGRTNTYRLCNASTFAHHSKYGVSSHSISKRETVRLAYEKFEPKTDSPGSQTPVVLLHGLCGSKQNWKLLAKSFADVLDTEVIALDARNHGDSAHTDSMDYLNMAADVVAFLERRGIEKVHLIGHSMGGKTAMTLALEQPKLLQSLIIEDTAPVESYGGGVYIRYIRAMMALDVSLNGERLGDVRRRCMKLLAPDVPEMGIRAFLLTNLTAGPKDVSEARWRCNLRALERNMVNGELFSWNRELFAGKQYTGPTLFIGGEKSGYTSKGKMVAEDVIRGYFPSVEFSIVSQAGHWVHSDQPGEFSKLVVDFISRP